MVGEIESSDPEVKKAQVHDTQAKEAKTLLERLHKFSDWARLVKAVARLKRLAKEIKGLKPRSSDASSLEERKEAELTIIKMVQEATLCQEIQCLRHHKETKLKDKVSQLHKLCPFLDDQEPLTPNHILTMKSTIILPPPGKFVKEDLYLRKRWRRVQLLTNNFWIRWKKEYLLNLQHRQKWTKDRRNAKVGDIVLLQDVATPRNQWKLARVIEVYPGSDERVRRLKLLISDSSLDGRGKRTSKPVYLERPIQKTVTLIEAD
ncbi:hypothetical protein F2P79_002628 [Pimephales promelas]|nr:hypothetical protein F2P79_002628 [Pimephales promelas]